MADIRCPMCSKLNPAERETCQHCQARLRPLRPTPPGSADLPDWLGSFRTDDPPDEEAAEAAPAAQDDIPDWLSSLRGPSDEPSQAGDTTGAADWPSSVEADQADEIDFPDWAGGQTPSQAEPNDGEPEPELDWTASFASDNKEEDEAEWLTPTLPESAASEDPDWLKDIWARQNAGSETMPSGDVGGGPSGEAGGGPSGEADGEGDTGEPEHAPDAQDLPDWLKNFAEEPEQAQVTETSEPAEYAPTESAPDEAEPVALPGEMPGWLAELAGGTDDDFLPPWLNQGDPAAPEEAPTILEPDQSEADSFSTGETPASLEPDDTEEDWLAQFAVEESAQPPPAAPKASASPFTFDDESEADLAPLLDEELPDWLANIRPDDAAMAAPDANAAFEEEDFFSLEEEQSGQGSGAAFFDTPAAGEDGLTPAQLPSWLEAMRPIDSSSQLQDESAGLVESAGPLAGIRGVLPAEPDISVSGKSSAFQLKLQVSDTQQANAALFEELIKTEDQAEPLIARRTISPQHILRILVGSLLFLAVLAPLALPGWSSPLPAAPLPEVAAAHRLIIQVGLNTPVLVAFDYDPGWSGEMDALAAPVLDHLMQRGAHLVIVSTSPTGSAQAERVLAQANGFPGRAPVYQSETHYSNLGFIPGGPAGLLAFAQSPRQVFPGGGLAGSPAWEHPALQGVTALDQFGLAIVFTENPEIARAWVEQVNPVLGDTPLIMGVSAQADPLVRPYYAAGANQLAGLLSGLEGGLHYEQLNARAETAHRYWGAYSLGLYAAAGLILVGGLFNALGGLLERRKTGEVEGSA